MTAWTLPLPFPSIFSFFPPILSVSFPCLSCLYVPHFHTGDSRPFYLSFTSSLCSFHIFPSACISPIYLLSCSVSCSYFSHLHLRLSSLSYSFPCLHSLSIFLSLCFSQQFSHPLPYLPSVCLLPICASLSHLFPMVSVFSLLPIGSLSISLSPTLPEILPLLHSSVSIHWE